MIDGSSYRAQSDEPYAGVGSGDCPTVQTHEAVEKPLIRRLKTFLLDDDPTGSQGCVGVDVVLDLTPEEVSMALNSDAKGVYVITNGRGLSPELALEQTRIGARAIREAAPDSRIGLRGDSTLRGHVVEEYRGVVADLEPHRRPVLVVVPALPSEGRVTLGGIHWVIADGTITALDQTEYATDGTFSYKSSRLLQWLEERSQGTWKVEHGTEVPLGVLRSEGPKSVQSAIHRAAVQGGVCAPDALTFEDLIMIHDGIILAEAAGLDVLIRCGPALGALLTDSNAEGLVAAPRSQAGVLVVCGSYVPTTTRQLRRVTLDLPDALIAADVESLADDKLGDREIDRLSREASSRLRSDGVAIVATPRSLIDAATGFDNGMRIAKGLAMLLSRLEYQPDVVIAKGGITSHVVARTGLGFKSARVVGPIAAGVSLWEGTSDQTGERASLVVFPGNVGRDELLLDVIQSVAAT